MHEDVRDEENEMMVSKRTLRRTKWQLERRDRDPEDENQSLNRKTTTRPLLPPHHLQPQLTSDGAPSKFLLREPRNVKNVRKS